MINLGVAHGEMSRSIEDEFSFNVKSLFCAIWIVVLVERWYIDSMMLDTIINKAFDESLFVASGAQLAIATFGLEPVVLPLVVVHVADFGKNSRKLCSVKWEEVRWKDLELQISVINFAGQT